VFANASFDFANTIVLEFLAGVLIGMAVQRDLRVPAAVAWVLLLGGFALLLGAPVVSGVLRPLTWGLPAAAIVMGSVGLERHLAPWLPRWLLAAGDASYAIYLTHGFVVPIVFLAVRHAELSPVISLVTILLGSLLFSALVGQVAHVVLERPMMLWFRRRPAPQAIIVTG
ncbi:MAG: acyltransferase family protein, partial [Acetobacteraceae bacterium]|nr:acyltransferase family protein [Acetobacteraceae bacterium]